MVRLALSGLAFLLVMGFAAAAAQPSPYYVLTPGGSFEIGERLNIPVDYKREMGKLSFVAVYAREANWLQYALARVSDSAEPVPAAAIRPPGASQQEVNDLNQRQIDESKPVAAAVALREAGFNVTISGQGALVNSVVGGLPAEGVLNRRDVIIRVDDTPVATSTEAVEALAKRRPGDPALVTVRRGDQEQRFTINTAVSPTDPTRAVIGVSISTFQGNISLPFPVQVDTGDVGGPSAGFMIALAVFDGVTDGDLTRGVPIAGTGTINVTGEVGRVGGVAEKIVSAEKDGARVFFVPARDVDEARRRARSATVVPVTTLRDAVTYLCGMAGPAPAPAACATTPR